MSRNHEFWSLHGRHVTGCFGIKRINREVQKLQWAVSREVGQSEEPMHVHLEPLPTQPWRPLPPFAIPEGAVRRYGDALVRIIILSWFWQVIDRGDHQMVWVSHFQLYADFMGSIGHPGPVHKQRRLDGATYSLQGHGFKQCTRWFVKVWKEALRHQNISLDCAFGKPCSQMVLMHAGVVALPWPKERLATVDRWMLKCSATTFRRQSKAIGVLPLIDRMAEFPEIYVSTAGL